MHTVASKVSARERELAPRYYYKLSEKTSCLEKIKSFIRAFLTFMFTQVGVIVLIASYMACGAALFQNIEADSQMSQATKAEKARENYTHHIWLVTNQYNVLRPKQWKERVGDIVLSFQEQAVKNVQNGYIGNDPGVRVWTFSSALMFSLTIFTTIGYGNLAPRTPLGKAMTILYALIGIPLMFIYMANIGSVLATSFKYIYSKLCRCKTKPADLPKRATLPASKSDNMSYLDEEIVSRGSSNSKASHEDSLSGFSNGSKKQRTATLRNIVEMTRKKNVYGQNELANGGTNNNNDGNHVHEESANHTNNGEAAQTKHGILEKFSSKMSKKSAAPPKDEGVKFKLVEDIRLVTIPITTCLFVLLSYIILGAVLFASWEDWSYLDGAYFCFTSLMTIGFGDFVPGNSYIYNVSENMSEKEANAKLVLGTIYILLGMGIIAMCVNLMQEKIITQVRLLVRTLGLIREFRDVEGEPL